MDDTRSKIMISAKELFILQGYKKTTIRQIVERSGVLIGSIYYLFKNKEEIFKSLVLEIFEKGDGIICNYFGEDLNPVFRYGIFCAIELTVVEEEECICEIYYEAYSLKSVFDGLVNVAAKRSQFLFEDYNPDFEFEDYYIRTLAIKGAMRSFIANRYLST
ncbi:TetR/AcrR family transcriptional regulator [Clostridium oryzae]|uniref:Putative HTH-type transcriptional regulator YxaF n=1 Tax=Clostridium oryzae TaxID=1450648 RepID=A0A1V4IVE1_9CLOT|nr:TetR/AcrR family transcriptional regulator [Clostridium oryzae]OPJ64028.1 putative HTH-type transcriptional regulator YxaF [Clostridium oryzae]